MTFLSAEQLHLTDAEYSALLLVEERFRLDPPEFLPEQYVECHRASPGRRTFFNMNYVHGGVKLTDHSCGTVMCLVGWARHLAQDAHIFYGRARGPIYQLFYPSYPAYQATSPQALKVLQNYLTTGKIAWNLIKEIAP